MRRAGVFILAAIVMTVVTACASTSVEPTLTQRDDRSAEIDALIEKLVLDDRRSDHARTAQFEAGYAAADRLREIGRVAWPRLLSHLDDERPAVPFRAIASPDVADACYYIVRGQLYGLPDAYYDSGSLYRKGPDGKLHERPYYNNDLFSYKTVGPWIEQRRDRSLDQINLEVAEWVLAEEEKIGVADPSGEAEYLIPLRAHVENLRKKVDQGVP